MRSLKKHRTHQGHLERMRVLLAPQNSALFLKNQSAIAEKVKIAFTPIRLAMLDIGSNRASSFFPGIFRGIFIKKNVHPPPPLSLGNHFFHHCVVRACDF